jgi:hypothetical protein
VGQGQGRGQAVPGRGPGLHEAPKAFPGLAGESRSGDANGQWFRVLGAGGTNLVQLAPGMFGTTTNPILGANPPKPKRARRWTRRSRARPAGAGPAQPAGRPAAAGRPTRARRRSRTATRSPRAAPSTGSRASSSARASRQAQGHRQGRDEGLIDEVAGGKLP